MIISAKYRILAGNKGIGLLDLLIVLGILSVLYSVLSPYIKPMFAASGRAKLQSDVYALNQAVATYRANGGDLSEELSMAELLLRLRYAPGARERGFDSGLNLAFYLYPEMQTPGEAKTGQHRVVWNSPGNYFEITDSGKPGAKSFRTLQEPLTGISARP